MKISEIGLGSWLTYGGSVEAQDATAQMHHAFECGINFFDTANVYAAGESEKVVGKAIKSLKRESVVLATKVFFPMGEGPNDKGLSRKHVFEQCHESLRRLGTDYIDLYQCHRFDPDVPLEELVVTMDILCRQGKILYWGVSEWPADQIQAVVDCAQQLNCPPPVSNQPCYNMLQRDIEKDVVPVSFKNGLGQIVFSPLAQGVLTGKYKPGSEVPADSRAASDRDGVFLRGRATMSKESLEKVQQLSLIAKEINLTMGQLALAWCLRLKEVSAVIIGARKISQIDENLQAGGVKLSGEIVARVDKILKQVMAKR